MTEDPKPKKAKRPQHVYTLLVEVGRSDYDDLPKDATGAALMCYASGVDEAEALLQELTPDPDRDAPADENQPMARHSLGFTDEFADRAFRLAAEAEVDAELAEIDQHAVDGDINIWGDRD